MKAGVKPIFGVEAYCGGVGEDTRSAWKNHLTVLAANSEGYRQLNRIVTQSYRDFYYHPTIGGDSLAANSSGLIALSGCSGSLLACSLLGGKGIPEPDSPDLDAAEEVIHSFLGTFGDRYFLEVQPFYELPRTNDINSNYAKLSESLGVPLVVTCDVHYPKPEDGEMQAVLHAVHRGKASVDDAMREWNYAVPLTLPSSDRDLADRLCKTGLTRQQAWSAIKWSVEIADMCNVTLPKAEPLRYPIEDKDLEPWS